MKIDLNDYRVVELRDSYDNDNILGVVLLNNKHTIDDFQNAIYKAKEEWKNEIYEYGCDWEFISRLLEDFDYIELNMDDYVEY